MTSTASASLPSHDRPRQLNRPAATIVNDTTADTDADADDKGGAQCPDDGRSRGAGRCLCGRPMKPAASEEKPGLVLTALEADALLRTAKSCALALEKNWMSPQTARALRRAEAKLLTFQDRLCAGGVETRGGDSPASGSASGSV